MSQAADYKHNYGFYPRLQDTFAPDGAIQSKVDRLIAAINSAESTGPSLPTVSTNPVLRNNITQVVFNVADKAQFPAVRSPTSSAPASVAPDQFAVAPRSIASTDLSTVVLNLEFIMSQQSQLLTAFMKTSQAQMDRQNKNMEKQMAQQNESLRQQQSSHSAQIETLVGLSQITPILQQSQLPQITPMGLAQTIRAHVSLPSVPASPRPAPPTIPSPFQMPVQTPVPMITTPEHPSPSERGSSPTNTASRNKQARLASHAVMDAASHPNKAPYKPPNLSIAQILTQPN